MSKKGYPGLVFVPPSDRTIVRRRIVRWSLISLAVVWGLSTFLSSLAPSNKSDCQPVDTSIAPSTTQADCNQAVASVPQSQPSIEEASPKPEAPPDTSPTEGRSSLISPSSEFTKPTSEQLPDHPSSVESPTDQNNGTDHTSMTQAELKSTSSPVPHQSTSPPTTANHQVVAQTVGGPASQHSTPSIQPPPGGKPAAQPGNGSVPTSSSHQPVKSASSAADHKVLTQAPRDPVTAPIHNQPTKTATSASTDQKLTGHSGNGGTPNQTNTKAVAPSAHTASDRKPSAQPGNGVSQAQASQPAKSVSPADHKQTSQPHNGSVPHQTSPHAGTPKPASPDRKVSAQLGNGSASHSHPTGTAHVGTGQYGNGASFNPTPLSDSSQDTRLAEEGDAFAQYRLGRFYAQQSGRQTPEAMKWYKRASAGLRRLAEAGNGQAMYILGVMYAYGRGVSQNTNEARLWLSQAIERKVSAARPVLASLEKDRSIAHTTR